MKPLHIETPLIQAPPELVGTQRTVWLKMDALQPSGSFKLRGVGRLVQARVAAGAKAVVCASGGNAGLAAAMAAKACGVPATIVVPHTTADSVRRAIEARGAQLMVEGMVWDESDQIAQALARQIGAAYVHPFDDPLLWEGHATLIDEVVAAGIEFDAVLVGVGGGGLLAGMHAGLVRHGLSTPLVAVETTGAASYAAALAAGQPVALPSVQSVASSLCARRVCAQAVALAQQHEVISLTVSDAQAVEAVDRFVDSARVLVEPACGAVIAALRVHEAQLARFKAPLVVVCGGSGVTLARLYAWSVDLDIR
ncbi:MAG: pyridoxal-phosphate dependent enzyme [Inhella sp.]